MARVQVRLVHRPIRPVRQLLRVSRKRPPEVCQVTILIIDRLRARLVRPAQEHREAARERFHVIRHITKAGPYNISDPAFAAEPRERRFEVVHKKTAFWCGDGVPSAKGGFKSSSRN